MPTAMHTTPRMTRTMVRTLHLLMHDSLHWLAARILRGACVGVTTGAVDPIYPTSRSARPVDGVSSPEGVAGLRGMSAHPRGNYRLAEPSTDSRSGRRS